MKTNQGRDVHVCGPGCHAPESPHGSSLREAPTPEESDENAVSTGENWDLFNDGADWEYLP